MAKHLVHMHSTVVEEGQPKLPEVSTIQYGELAVNYAKDHETISFKNSSDEIVTVKSDAYYQEKLDSKQDTLIPGTGIEITSGNTINVLMEDLMSYGIEFDVTVSSPDVTRIGNMDLHRSLPVQSKMRGCLLSDDGGVNHYLNNADWTSETRDGSAGQVMVEIPEHWRKFETDGNKRRVRISEVALPGYHRVRRCYVSAYEATVQRSTTTLCSVVNTDPDYRGGNNTSAWDGTYRTLLGRPATSINRINFRAYARKRKADSAEWNCQTYEVRKTLYWLFVTEYATLDSQKAYNGTRDENGLMQGGLGNGVTLLTDSNWSNFNNYNPFVPCGYTDALGNGSGIVEFQMPAEYTGGTTTMGVPRYRGIENPYGHVWEWTDGCNIRIQPGDTGLSMVYVTDNPSIFNDSDYEGYKHLGNEARANGYMRTMIFGDEGCIIPDTVGGSSTTYFCDYHWTNIPASETLRGLLSGGGANTGSHAGLVFSTSDYTPASSNAHVGSRLVFYPANI